MINLIDQLHPALNTNPIPESVLNITALEAIWLSISDDRIVLQRADAPADEILLGATTIGGLVALLPASVSASLISATWSDVGAVALLPLAGQPLAPGETIQLSAYTAGLWRLLRPLAAGLAAAAADLDGIMRQLDIRQAAGPWLDLWGLTWGIPRLPDELDPAYRRRIIYTLALPRANNQALEILIYQALGLTARITDGSVGGLLTLGSVGDTLGPSVGVGLWGPQASGAFVVAIDQIDGSYSLDQLLALIRQYKAAGVSFSVALVYAPTATVQYSEVSASLEE